MILLDAYTGELLLRHNLYLLKRKARFTPKRLTRAHGTRSFAGQTVGIQFRGTNDITSLTSFRVDDVSLQ